jgi:hypothetical protein
VEKAFLGGMVMVKKEKKLEFSKVPYYPDSETWIMCDETGKTWAGAPVKSRTIWEVNDPNEKGKQFTCRNQFEAEVISTLYDIQHRLKKLEKRCHKI